MAGIATLGLFIDALGALVVLAPRLPILMRTIDRFWWFKELEHAKAELYREGMIDKDVNGFEHIAAAIEYGSNWTNRSGEQLENSGKNEVELDIEIETPEGETTRTETHNFEDTGYDLFAIERVDDDDAYPMLDGLDNRRPPLSQAIFELKYRPRAAEKSEIPVLKAIHLSAESPPGQLPRFVQDHKERLVFRLGGGLLFIGFNLQLIASVEMGILGF